MKNVFQTSGPTWFSWLIHKHLTLWYTTLSRISLLVVFIIGPLVLPQKNYPCNMYYKGVALCQQSIVCILVDIQLDQWHTHHTMHFYSPHLISSYNWDLFLVILVYNSYKIAGLLQNIVSETFDFFFFFFVLILLKNFFEWTAYFLNKNAKKMQIIRSRSPRRIWHCIYECNSGQNRLNVNEKEKKWAPIYIRKEESCIKTIHMHM